MKNTDIQKIRHYLQQAKEACPGTYIQIDKALALLPCETCGGTKEIMKKDRYGPFIELCPDCRS